MLVFFDILIYSRSLEELMKHLATVLSVLAENPFVANFKKCQFGAVSIHLGHIVSAGGVFADPTKLKAM